MSKPNGFKQNFFFIFQGRDKNFTFNFFPITSGKPCLSKDF